jgi:sugar phosphate isomerase/epimerase
LTWYDFCTKVKAAGYDGVEAGIPFDETEKNEIIRALEKHDLLLLGSILSVV